MTSARWIRSLRRKRSAIERADLGETIGIRIDAHARPQRAPRSSIILLILVQVAKTVLQEDATVEAGSRIDAF